ncbi:MAG: TIGR02996 domain-containing protein [Archangium sp.]
MKAIDQLRVVLARREDLAARKVYADLLQEEGDARGEFISLQCELASSTDEARRAALVERERELLEVHRSRWIHEAGLSSSALVVFRGGFVEELTCRSEEFVARGAAIVASTPLRKLALIGVSHDELAALTASSVFDALEDLSLNSLTTEPFAPLARVRFTRLRALRVAATSDRIAPQLDALRLAPWFQAVETLELRLRLTRSTFTRADEPVTRKLKALHLTLRPGERFDSLSLPELRELRLRLNDEEPGDAVFEKLRHSPLERLDLDRARITERAQERIRALGLERLTLSRCAIADPAGLERVATQVVEAFSRNRPPGPVAVG